MMNIVNRSTSTSIRKISLHIFHTLSLILLISREHSDIPLPVISNTTIANNRKYDIENERGTDSELTSDIIYFIANVFIFIVQIIPNSIFSKILNYFTLTSSV
jgi:hypothetical protein